MLGCVVGCQPAPQSVIVEPPPRQGTTVIIERNGRPCPPPVIVNPPYRRGVHININGCNVHRHCGCCDYCRHNGWHSAVGIDICR